VFTSVVTIYEWKSAPTASDAPEDIQRTFFFSQPIPCYSFDSGTYYFHCNINDSGNYDDQEWNPEWFRMDEEARKTPAVKCRLSWQAEVATWRRRLWGDDEDDVDLHMVLNNRVALGSIFAPIK
jgi:hypothetical protein